MNYNLLLGLAAGGVALVVLATVVVATAIVYRAAATLAGAAKEHRRGLAVGALVLAVILATGFALGVHGHQAQQETPAQHRAAVAAEHVHYTLSGESPDPVQVIYGDDLTPATSTVVTALPWAGQIHFDATAGLFGLTATLGADGGTLTCTVSVEGRTWTSAASGPGQQCRVSTQ